MELDNDPRLEPMNRLHEKGYILDPVSKAKSVVLTEEGEREAERLCRQLFAKG
jgi:Mn-dependent DtxR family transcriptional regulator